MSVGVNVVSQRVGQKSEKCKYRQCFDAEHNLATPKSTHILGARSNFIDIVISDQRVDEIPEKGKCCY